MPVKKTEPISDVRVNAEKWTPEALAEIDKKCEQIGWIKHGPGHWSAPEGWKPDSPHPSKKTHLKVHQ